MGAPPLPPNAPLGFALPSDGILSFLKSSKPGDALCVLGLTLSDLYPCEAWSFTFGKILPGHGEPGPLQPMLMGPHPGCGPFLLGMMHIYGWKPLLLNVQPQALPAPGQGATAPPWASALRPPQVGRPQGWPSGRVHPEDAEGALLLRPPPTPPCDADRDPSCLHLSPEVGVCSFARFSGELLQSGPGASEPALVQAAADGPETPVQDRDQTLCFSALGMVQCCKVGVEARASGSLHRRREKMGQGRMEGLGALPILGTC